MKTTNKIKHPGEEVDTTDLMSSARLELTIGKMINVLKTHIVKREYLSVPFEVHENETRYLMTFDLPGVSCDDIEVKLVDSRLIISGKKCPLDTAIGDLHQPGEVIYKKLQKVVMLPPFVDPDKIEANYHNGVLQLIIRKTEVSQRSRKITVRYEPVNATEESATGKNNEGWKHASSGKQAA